mmetsp:Transcript_42528/g.92641  ORF Transcript_42528/g.92641 Transcript_42528/m.92641 type:complete len:284 (+) Transcript_42528:743-1594(+)
MERAVPISLSDISLSDRPRRCSIFVRRDSMWLNCFPTSLSTVESTIFWTSRSILSSSCTRIACALVSETADAASIFTPPSTGGTSTNGVSTLTRDRSSFEAACMRFSKSCLTATSMSWSCRTVEKAFRSSRGMKNCSKKGRFLSVSKRSTRSSRATDSAVVIAARNWSMVMFSPTGASSASRSFLLRAPPKLSLMFMMLRTQPPLCGGSTTAWKQKLTSRLISDSSKVARSLRACFNKEPIRTLEMPSWLSRSFVYDIEFDPSRRASALMWCVMSNLLRRTLP